MINNSLLLKITKHKCNQFPVTVLFEIKLKSGEIAEFEDDFDEDDFSSELELTCEETDC
jgi:hypothetical protein